MIDLLAAAILGAAPVPAAAPTRAGASDRLSCASAGTQAAAVIDIPAGITRIAGVARRTVARPGGRRIPGVTAGFQLRIGVMDARHSTVAGLFLESGSPEPGPPQVAHHFFGSFGRYRTGAPFEYAERLGGRLPFVTAPGDVIRFAFEIAPDGAVSGRASWDAGGEPREAGGLIPPAESRPVQLIVQCEVDDFAIEYLTLS